MSKINKKTKEGCDRLLFHLTLRSFISFALKASCFWGRKPTELLGTQGTALDRCLPTYLSKGLLVKKSFFSFFLWVCFLLSIDLYLLI